MNKPQTLNTTGMLVISEEKQQPLLMIDPPFHYNCIKNKILWRAVYDSY